ncbi:hypothetical protein LSG31_07925 [Fodinisporobacter ferrooxydans]|uniref:Uncharacterized protein n=1 Tax=Fodinisporobacter ferrooxydans TaxID=2901836 RepID=A0ABY4CNP0_9BACL|nr:hypothetical protein LSG31_07925 [Alicyclobacillaceae bacterium MYW30-H2]
MRFDTFLKMGSYLADIWKHESFQEMSKMVHKGIRRRMDSYDSSDRYLSHPYSSMNPNRPQKRQSDRKQMLLPQQQNRKNLGELITPETIQSAFQLHQTIKKFLDHK